MFLCGACRLASRRRVARRLSDASALVMLVERRASRSTTSSQHDPVWPRPSDHLGAVRPPRALHQITVAALREPNTFDQVSPKHAISSVFDADPEELRREVIMIHVAAAGISCCQRWQPRRRAPAVTLAVAAGRTVIAAARAPRAVAALTGDARSDRCSVGRADRSLRSGSIRCPRSS
jgi:hypothetical protein